MWVLSVELASPQLNVKSAAIILENLFTQSYIFFLFSVS